LYVPNIRRAEKLITSTRMELTGGLEINLKEIIL
jgi:hypothetical protein